MGTEAAIGQEVKVTLQFKDSDADITYTLSGANVTESMHHVKEGAAYRPKGVPVLVLSGFILSKESVLHDDVE